MSEKITQDPSFSSSPSVPEDRNGNVKIADVNHGTFVPNNSTSKEKSLTNRITGTIHSIAASISSTIAKVSIDAGFIKKVAPITSAASFPVIAAGLVAALTTAAPLGVGIAIAGVGITILAIAVSVMIITQQNS